MRCLALIFVIILKTLISVHGQISDFDDINFRKADSIAGLFAAHSLNDLKGLADKLSAPLLSEAEKFRAIYKWVCNNIEVDYALVTINKQKRSTLRGENLIRWNKEFNALVFKTLLHDRRTICTGYAYLIRELAFHAGVGCGIVYGYAKPGGVNSKQSLPVNHSWNSIRLNDKWYWCDATWSSGFFDLSTGQFKKRYNDKYFLVDPEIFQQSHRPVNPLYQE